MRQAHAHADPTPNAIPEVFARQKANRWKVARTTAKQRVEKLRRLRDQIRGHRKEICDAIYADFRKPPVESEITEVLITLAELNDAIKHTADWMKPRKVKTPITLFGTSGHVRYEPKGNTLILAPWNYPFQLAIAPLIAAVSAGNTAMLKPSEKTPHTSAVLKKLLAAVFSDDEVALFEGGPEVAEALLALPFDHIFFTGSTRIGRKVMTAAAQHLATVTLELGGKSPAIIHSSANLDQAAEQIGWGKFVNAGQTCVAPDYVLVHASKERQFVEALRAHIEKSFGSTDAARKQSPDLCRVVDGPAFQRLRSLVTEAKDRGAKVELGADFDEAERYVSPTVLTSVPKEVRLMQEEIFGPILPVVTYDREEEIFQHVDEAGKPLALYVFAEDNSAVERILRNTSAGGTVVNNVLIHLGNSNLPFGGVGPSGQGNYHGEYGFKAFSHERAVLKQGPMNFVRLLHPPYEGERIRKMLAALRRIAG